MVRSNSDAQIATTKGRLELKNVTKSYGQQRVVDDISLDVAPGEFVTLLGPSGSGKTTTLRIIAGFIQPDQGRVLLDGRDMTKVPPYRRDIGMVFQNYALFPHMSTAENVGFPLQMRGVPKAQIRDRVRESLRLVQLEGFGDRRPHQLSGGQQQRVALARSFSFNPQLLLMDEPLGALDRKLRESLQLELLRISREVAITVVSVTHDQEEALVMSHRIAIYDNGGIQQVGSAEDLYERPVSRFVADFVGQSNIFRGVYRSTPSPAVIVPTIGQIPVTDGAAARVGIRPGEPAAVVVRPERMTVRDGNGRSEDALAGARRVTLRGVLGGIIYLGSDRKYTVEIGERKPVVIRVPAGSEGTGSVVGPEVTVSWDVDDAVVVTDAADSDSDDSLTLQL
jgi:putative spermidine/putrescine transport system ATP-binding protein